MSPRKREITCLGHTVVGDRTWARAHLYSSFDPKTRFFTLKLKLQIGDVWAGPATALLHAHSQFAVISPPHHLLYSCYTRGHYLLGPCRHLSEQLILYRKQFLTWINRFKCSWIQLNIQKTKITASGPITSWQIDGETVANFTFLGSKITADGDCSHEIKRCSLLGRKAMTNLDSILKSRDITLPTKIHLVKAMVLSVIMYGCESWTLKKAQCQRIDAFELWCWRRLLRVPWTARRSNQSTFACVDHNELWKFWKSWEYQTTWPASWEICMQVRKQHLELDMEQQTGSK